MTVPHLLIRPLRASDAKCCNQIIASLPYRFGQEDGRQECALAVRSQPGLAAMLDEAVVGFLTLQRHFDHAAEITWMAVHASHRHHGIGRALINRLCQDLAAEGRRLLLALTVSPSDPGWEPPDGYQATRAFCQAMGFVLARDLPGLWPKDTAVLLVRPLLQALRGHRRTTLDSAQRGSDALMARQVAGRIPGCCRALERCGVSSSG
jgi:ribosomal protein S18 acetylase RimI-like enzyme